jgi:hypothetical protein
VEDAQELLKQQFELFKHELRSDFIQVKTAAQVLAVGAGVGLVGCFLLGITLSLALQAATEMSWWAAFAIITAFFVIGAGVLIAIGLGKLNSVNPLPDQTAEALKENVQWITKPK